MKTCVSAASLRAPLFMALLVCADISVVRAQSIPAPWTASDIGAPAVASTSTQTSGIYTINAAGADVWGTSDQFHFIYQQIAGDTEVIARVDSVVSANDYAKAGVMVRSSLTSGSRHVFVHATEGAGVRIIRRLSDGSTSTATSGTSAGAPVWLRIVRTGSTVRTFSSPTGTTWTAISTQTISLGTSAYYGIAVNGVSTTTRSTAKVSSLKVLGAKAGVPAGQQNSDIGSPAVAGSVSYASGVYTIKAGGTDIWDVADQFHFVYQPVSGDVTVVARVSSIVNTHAWAKAGVMVRESLAANSPHATTLASAASGYAFQRRPYPSEYSVHSAGGSGITPGWVKLVRTGDTFHSYRSVDGAVWIRISSDTIPMNDTVYVGIAVTSHNIMTATTAKVDNLRIIATTNAANRPPAVSLTAPLNGTKITAPATVTLTASVTDPEARMASVDFYAGSTLIVRDTTAPYSASWSATASGTVALSAVAHDADGGSTTSSAVSVTVATATATTAPKWVVFKASADHATNVTSYRLKVFAAGANTASATPVATSDLGKPTPASTGDITVDRSTVFAALAAGNYVTTVTAIGPGGQTASSGVTFTR